jgi:hypothetical protein
LPARRRRWRGVGYAEFLEGIAGIELDEHEGSVAWGGGSFDPAEFDLAYVNARCQKVR